MMIKTLDRLNGEGYRQAEYRLEILSEKARDCKSVEAIRCISSGSGIIKIFLVILARQKIS